MDSMTEYDETFDFDKAIVCQKRKLRAKQLVIICEITDQTLFKGPFNDPKSTKGTGNQKLADLISRADTMRKWDTPLVVLPIRDESDKVSTLNFNFQNPAVTGRFVEFPNLIAGIEHRLEIFTEKEAGTKDKKEPGLTYKIISERNTIVRMSDYIAKHPDETWFYEPDILRELILAHIHLFALGSGDRNLSNILVNTVKKQLHIVDFEETRSADTADELFYFTQPPAKKLADVWVQKTRAIYADLLDLENFDLQATATPDQQKKLNKAREILESFLDAKGDYTSRPRQSKPKDGEKPEQTPAKRGAKKDPETPKAPRIVKPLTIIDNGNLGKMNWAGLLSKDTKSYSGYSLDILREAIQSYIRNGDTEKALMTGVELYRLREAGGEYTPVKTLINRLILSAAEDIGLADISLVLQIFETFNKCGQLQFQAIAEIIKAMCEAKKSQLVPQVWRTYATDEGRTYATKKYGEKLPVEWGLVEEDMKIFNDRIDESPFWIDGDPEILKPYGENFYDRLSHKEWVAIGWLAMFLEQSIGSDKKNLKAGKRDKRTQPIEVIWQMLGRWDCPMKTGPNDSILINILSETYHDIPTNGVPIIVLAVLCVLNQVKSSPHPKLSPVNVDKLLDGDYTLMIDEDYIVEKKAVRGRGAKEKAFRPSNPLANQCEKWVDERYHDVYMSA
ncbi:Hypothetical protein POVR1_LOCUS24 [uncultured virus]|nr:Hypothetical protein POVR1_LOCUS24 [uncultured virus]